jgi:hemimethylated DNA binding protein
MRDSKQIPYLLKLIDDESSSIQEKVFAELSSYGPSLKDEIKKLSLPLNPVQKDCIEQIYQSNKKEWLKQIWPSWFDLNKDNEKLEGALTILSDFLSDYDSKVNLKQRLDILAIQYKEKHRIKDERLLARFLFKDKGLLGDEDDYYNPQNCNLNYVIKGKKGIPISLASIYMLVGARLGLHIEGCHFPGHFLTRINWRGRQVFVDCFSNGQIIELQDILAVRSDIQDGLEDILRENVDAETIIRRFLSNLVRSYQMIDNEEHSQLMTELFRDLDMRVADKRIPELTPDEIIIDVGPLLNPGQVVRHVRHGYRGVIVETDTRFRTIEKWFDGSRMQYSRRQPWYHVLVHDTDQVTYVSESNLLSEQKIKPITHPLLPYFFDTNPEGKYIRNANPWPSPDF